jgi:hypothetical protein
MYKINNHFKIKTYQLLSNNFISFKFIKINSYNSKLIILNNYSNIDINKLFTKNLINFKQL